MVDLGRHDDPWYGTIEYPLSREFCVWRADAEHPLDVLARLNAAVLAALPPAPEGNLADVLAAGVDAGALAGIVSGSGPTCAFLSENEDAAVRLSNALAGSDLARAVRLLSAWLSASSVLPVHDLLDRITHEGEVVARYRRAVPEAMRASVCANLRELLLDRKSVV